MGIFGIKSSSVGYLNVNFNNLGKNAIFARKFYHEIHQDPCDFSSFCAGFCSRNYGGKNLEKI
jgi:hypothetical protein